MKPETKTPFRFLVILPLILCCHAFAAPEPVTLPLWPEGVPSARLPTTPATAKLLQSYGGATATRVSEVNVPTITVYRPENPNGAAVVVAPGGGYMFLSYAT